MRRGALTCAVLLWASAANGSELLPRQDFTPNAPGSYRLASIQPAADGWVLERNWMPRRLSSYTKGSITLLSFVYTYCTDPLGCPLAYNTFFELRKRLNADPAMRGKVRLVSVSFDPTHDTPQAMQDYGGANARGTANDVPWRFLTTYSTRFLKPILDDFGQDVEIELDQKGNPTRARTHMLKVFLIDKRSKVREIYSVAFMHPDVIFNDIKTLLIEQRPGVRETLNATAQLK
jgi:protein SCO1